MTALIEKMRAWARRINRDALTIWFARRHPSTPWYAKALGASVVAYALSPVDLIPDFIPVLGYLDDVILLPVLIWLTVRMLPPVVVAESRLQADKWIAEQGSKPKSMTGAVLIAIVWITVAAAIGLWLYGVTYPGSK